MALPSLGGMSGANRVWILKIIADIDDAKKGINEIEQTTKGFGAKMGQIGKGIVAGIGTAAVVDFANSAIQAASDVQQSAGAVQSVFREYSNEVLNYAETTASTLGISKSEFQQLSAVMGAMLKNAGVPMKDLAGQTIDLTERAADMAATFGTDVPQAMEAISSALRGERDPIEKFGVSIKQTDVDARAAALGYVDAEGKVTSLGKTMATMALIMEQTSDIQGQNAREADTWAGQQERLNAQFQDMKADLGEKLLPVMVEFFKILRPIVEFISKNVDWLVPLAGIILGVAAAMWVLNIALAANPIVLLVGAIIVAVAALVALIYVLITRWDEIYAKVAEVCGKVRDALWGLINWIGNAFRVVWDWITWPFVEAYNTINRWVGQVIDVIRWMVDQINRVFSFLWDVITYPFRRAAEFITNIFKPIVDFFYRFPGMVQGFFSQLADIITYPFRKAFEFIKWLWNSTLGGFGFTIPSWIPFVGGKEFRIPKMALGGVVTRPTLALIGEAGPEAVIPLSQMGAMGGGEVTVVNLNVYALTANEEVGRKVYEAMAEYQRVTGRGLLPS